MEDFVSTNYFLKPFSPSVQYPVMSEAPKVFVSHASEDKERFVLRFAEKLRANGIDAWLDKWEMKPGDSLVDKIFEEGIKNAKAIIVIVSKHSVEKPWVREELNAAMVRKINGLSRLIPVIIDQCEIPECLRATVWERISDLEKYDDSLSRVVQAIFGISERPALGQAPKYTRAVFAVSGLKAADSSVFIALCELCVKKDTDWIDNHQLLEIPRSLELSEELFCESLEILKSQAFVDLKQINGGDIDMARPTTYGFERFMLATREKYGAMFELVASLVVNEKKLAGNELSSVARSKNPSLTELIVNHIIRVLERKGWIKTARHNGFTPCSFTITDVGPQLTRWLRECGEPR